MAKEKYNVEYLVRYTSINGEFSEFAGKTNSDEMFDSFRGTIEGFRKDIDEKSKGSPKKYTGIIKITVEEN